MGGKVEKLSSYRVFNRNYTPEEILGEFKLFIADKDYEDFVFIAAGRNGRVVRLASRDADLRVGDVLWLLRLIEGDLLDAI